MFNGKKILVTGHTGFKGSWLCKMLLGQGAEVCGYSLKPNTTPNMFSILGLEEQVKTIHADVRNFTSISGMVKKEKPDLVFHLAAQPLVRDSYDDPLYTFSTNVMGTANVLEAIRKEPSVRASVVITTDKVYSNKETQKPYVETDELGGHDPYSASKACAELVTQSYSKSFFKGASGGEGRRVFLATARAGNIIGGGDWSKDRLVPDIVRCLLEKNEQVVLRNPMAVRPWQHVLDPLMGYMILANGLLDGNADFEGAWNFSPDPKECVTVEGVVKKAIGILGKGSYAVRPDSKKHEMELLLLNSTKARKKLCWEPHLDIKQAMKWTFEWYSDYYEGKDAVSATDSQISRYLLIEG